MAVQEEIVSKFKEFDKRLSTIEKALFKAKHPPVKEKEEDKYNGLRGGIQLLIDNAFLNGPQSADAIQNELRREGYHYPSSSVRKMLSVDFMKNRKTLTRIKEDRIWKYVIRK